MKRLLFILLAISGVAWANTPPTRISFTGATTAASTATTLSTASISYNIGDVLVVTAVGAGSTNQSFNTPTTTGSGITFAVNLNHASSSNCEIMIATSTASATSSGTVTVTIPSAEYYSIGVVVYRNATGIGNVASQFTATRTVGLTPTQANSAIVWALGDWAAAATQSGTPTPTTTNQSAVISGQMTYYAFDLTNQTSTGSTFYGIGGSGTGPFSIGVIEVKGTSTANPSMPPVIY